jgi:hypothetical protein
MILTDKKVSDFIKKLNDLNQIMKGIYKDETNFSPRYLLTESKALYTDEDAIPEIVEYIIDENFEGKFTVIVDAKDLYDMLKDFKKEIVKIEINEDSLKFYNDNDILFTINNDKVISYNIIDKYNKYNNTYDNSEYILKADMSEDLIHYIKENNKELIECIIDADNECIHIKDKVDMSNIESYITFFINHKFLNGYSYKIKHLKKGDVVECTPVEVLLYEGKGENYYNLNINVYVKNDVIKHHLMICDF